MDDDVKSYFRDKRNEFAVQAYTVLFDTALAVVWLTGEYCLEYCLSRFRVSSLVPIGALWIFRILFAISTLVPCASAIFKHVRIVWLRDRAQVRNVKEKLTANGAGGAP